MLMASYFARRSTRSGKVESESPHALLLEGARTHQWCSLDELANLQSSALSRLLRHAYENVPYYRKQLEQAGLHPSDVRGVEHLDKLPLLSRDQAQPRAPSAARGQRRFARSPR
jgi:phenylacetate-coenzyme A ligase PaaK-like adenylate-forming protein